MKKFILLSFFILLIGIGFVSAETFTEPGTYEVQSGDIITFNNLTIQVIDIKTNDNNVSWNQDFGREMVYLSTPGLGFYVYIGKKMELNKAKYSDEKPIAVLVNSIDLVNKKAIVQFINNLKEEESTCTDSDGGKNIYQLGDVNAPNLDLDSGSDLAGEEGKDFCLPRPELYNADLAEYYCQNNEAVKEFVSCTNGCSGGSCIGEKESEAQKITEQITCYFVNSEKEQECYIAGGIDYSTDEGTKFCRGVETCIIKVSGYKGGKITWKSSCGGYDYTLMDGVDNNVDFDCSEGESNETEIKNIWFKSAYWQCYDGEEQKSEDDTSCKSSETWQKYAKEFCDGHCYEDGSKCGVNSFSVSNECYPDLDEIEESTEEPAEMEASLICKNSCPLNEKCYPFGYRKDGKYCSDETNFVDYKASKSICENNFECKSNVCVNSECISEGLIKSILNWFKKLFS